MVTAPPSTWLPRDRPAERLGRCIFGLVLFGVGISLQLGAELGGAPWDVLHTGLAERFGLDVGAVIIGVGVALLLLWIPLRERPGLGTVLNALVIGLVVDAVLPLVDGVDEPAVRVVLLLTGVATVAAGSGFYIGAGLGPGPRDGLMTGLGRRGLPIGRARTGIEVSVVALGVALGGQVGIGTLVFALGIGPLVARALPRFSMPARTEPPPATLAPAP